MAVTCPECGIEGVQRDETTFNVVYECPGCGKQLACAIAKE